MNLNVVEKYMNMLYIHVVITILKNIFFFWSTYSSSVRYQVSNEGLYFHRNSKCTKRYKFEL